MNPDDSSAAERLRRAAAAVSIPANVRTAWNRVPPEPAPGQIWRATWGPVAELLLILDLTESRVRILPVTLDVDYADDAAVIAPAAASPLVTTLVIWTGLVRELPLPVLDRCAGTIGDDWSSLASLRRAIEAGEATPGAPIAGANDPRVEYKARLDDDFDLLAEAEWVPRGSGRLPALLQSAHVGSAQLAELLEAAPHTVLALLRGLAPVSEDDARRLSEVLDQPIGEILGANPELPRDLVVRLSRPARRWQVRKLAAARDLTEVEAWRTAAYGGWALAARQTGSTSDPAWDLRLDRYFHAVLDD